MSSTTAMVEIPPAVVAQIEKQVEANVLAKVSPLIDNLSKSVQNVNDCQKEFCDFANELKTNQDKSIEILKQLSDDWRSGKDKAGDETHGDTAVSNDKEMLRVHDKISTFVDKQRKSVTVELMKRKGIEGVRKSHSKLVLKMMMQKNWKIFLSTSATLR